MVASAEVAQRAIEIFQRATELNRSIVLRRGNVIELSEKEGDDVLIAGDLHGHRINFRRVCQLADLPRNPRRHLVLQEVCHGGPTYPHNSGCMSHLLLEDVARMKVEFKERVHFLLSNHELAELTDFPIAKGSRMLNLAFRSGLNELYGNAAESVRSASLDFVASCPLAVRLSTGVFLCHSVPENVVENGFDLTVFDRPLTEQDLQADGAAFRLVWGRDYRESNVRAFLKLLGVDYIVQGHERCPEGARVLHNCQVILDCCSESACVVNLPLRERLSFEDINRRICSLDRIPGSKAQAKKRFK